MGGCGGIKVAVDGSNCLPMSMFGAVNISLCQGFIVDWARKIIWAVGCVVGYKKKTAFDTAIIFIKEVFKF